MDRGVWQAAVHGVSKSRTQLKTGLTETELSSQEKSKTGFGVLIPTIHQVSSQDVVFNLKLEINIYLALVSNQKCTNLRRNIWKKTKGGRTETFMYLKGHFRDEEADLSASSRDSRVPAKT